MLKRDRPRCRGPAAYWSGGTGSSFRRRADEASCEPPQAGSPPAVNRAIRPGPAPAGRVVCDRPAPWRRGLVHRGSRTGGQEADLRLVARRAADCAVLVVSLLRLADPAVRLDDERGPGGRRGHLGAGAGAAAPGPGGADQRQHDLDAPAGLHVGVHPADRAAAVARAARGRSRGHRLRAAPATWPMPGC